MKAGWLRHWNGRYGFVKPSGARGDAFVLLSQFERAGIEPIEGLQVWFADEPDARGLRVTEIAAR